jgi:hypothetical protein
LECASVVWLVYWGWTYTAAGCVSVVRWVYWGWTYTAAGCVSVVRDGLTLLRGV